MMETVHRAKYALADAHTLIADAAVHVGKSGVISRISTWKSRDRGEASLVVDWGSVILLPGLVNAHTHLELTDLQNRINRHDSFTDWLSKLISLRRGMDEPALQASFNKGIALSLASGTTAIGDISSTGIARGLAQLSPLRKVIFEEAIALSESRADEKMSEVEQILDSSKAGELFAAGVSPHAPYTVSAGLYRRLARLAKRRSIPLATHIAETEQEVEFLKTGTGEFRRFLQAMRAFPPDWEPPGLHPISYMDSLGVLGSRCLLVHCNYPEPSSIARIAESGSSVVYCPRSHAFFGHSKHPVRGLLDAGVSVALGTDSLASNKSLSILDEMRFLFLHRPDVKPEEILQMATVHGARALNLGDRLGQLKPGFPADMTVLDLPSNTKESRILHQILEGAGVCAGTVVGGKPAWSRSG
jgi:cytosine/adenosine deaminase-related metal-dependent hydrolase